MTSIATIDDLEIAYDAAVAAAAELREAYWRLPLKVRHQVAPSIAAMQVRLANELAARRAAPD